MRQGVNQKSRQACVVSFLLYPVKTGGERNSPVSRGFPWISFGFLGYSVQKMLKSIWARALKDLAT